MKLAVDRIFRVLRMSPVSDSGINTITRLPGYNKVGSLISSLWFVSLDHQLSLLQQDWYFHLTTDDLPQLSDGSTKDKNGWTIRLYPRVARTIWLGMELHASLDQLDERETYLHTEHEDILPTIHSDIPIGITQFLRAITVTVQVFGNLDNSFYSNYIVMTIMGLLYM